jgi:hypothetical protein
VLGLDGIIRRKEEVLQQGIVVLIIGCHGWQSLDRSFLVIIIWQLFMYLTNILQDSLTFVLLWIYLFIFHISSLIILMCAS